MNSDVVTIVNTVVGAAVTIAVAWIGYMQVKAKSQQDKIEAKQKEMQSEQQVTAKVAVETRDWVNGLKKDVLLRHMTLAKEFAEIKDTPESRHVAEQAAIEYHDHMRQQIKNDAKDVKVAAVQEKVRAIERLSSDVATAKDATEAMDAGIAKEEKKE